MTVPGFDSEYDVLVIGAGIAGVSLGYEAARHGRVLVVEMEDTLAFHATGRSAAMFLETYGGVDVRALTQGSRTFLEGPPAEYMEEVLRPRPFLQIAVEGRGAQLENLHEEVRHMVSDVRLLTRAETETLCPILRAGVVDNGLYEPSAMEIDVHALHSGYVRGIRAQGGEVLRGTVVLTMESIVDGWRVTCGNGRTYRAATVVNAAGAWADQVAELAGCRPLGLTPLRRSAFTTAAPEGVEVGDLPLLYDVDETFYLKPEGDQLLCSPADKTPTPPSDARPDELEIARALDQIRDLTTVPARSVRTAWAGLRTFSRDGNLVIGEDPDQSGFVWLAAQGGYGVQTAPAAARLAAAIVRHEAPPDDLVGLGMSAERLAPARFARAE